MNPDPDIKKIIAAARAGGEVLRKYYGQVMQVTVKSGVSDVRTKADVESEQAVLRLLTADFPDYNIFAEEAGKVDKKSAYTFVIDPLDGTNNFVLGIPNFCVSIGLMKKVGLPGRDGLQGQGGVKEEVVSAVIYAPMIDHVYYAEKGKGAFLDGMRLQVNGESVMKNCTIAYNCGYDAPKADILKVFSRLEEKDLKRITFNWCPTFDYCLLAAGRLEGVINYGLEPYDFMAGKLIATEAGAKLTDFEGKAEGSEGSEKDAMNTVFLLSNGTRIHEELVEAVA